MSAIDDLQAIDDDDDKSLQLTKEMELNTAENGFQELNDILKDNEPPGPNELLPSCISNKEQISEEYAFGNLPTNNDDFSYYEFCASPQQIFSPLQAGFSDNVVFSDAQFVVDDERLLSSPKEYYQQNEGEDLCNDYLSRSSFQVELNNMDAEVSGTVTESSLKQEIIGEQEMVHESVISLSNNESVKSEFVYEEAEDEVLEAPKMNNEITKSEDEVLDVLDMTDSPIHIHGPPCSSLEDTPKDSTLIPQIDNENHASLNTSQQEERYIHDDDSARHLTASPRHYHELESIHKDMDGEASEQIIESSSKIHVAEEQEMEDSPKRNVSPEGSDHSIPPKDKKNHDSAGRVSESPRNQHSQTNHRSRKRSVSKSPSRRKESSSRHRRDHRERSRSRSPRRRQHYRRSRSPRRRYSPSYKSPPSSYRSRYRSPKRRNWSPPHNRSTGLGKPGKNLFIAGFCFLTTERDLERKFSRFGRVRDVRIVRNKRSGESRGFGFLTLERDEEADEAIRVLDKTEWNGRIILVEKSKPNS